MSRRSDLASLNRCLDQSDALLASMPRDDDEDDMPSLWYVLIRHGIMPLTKWRTRDYVVTRHWLDDRGNVHGVIRNQNDRLAFFTARPGLLARLFGRTLSIWI